MLMIFGGEKQVNEGNTGTLFNTWKIYDKGRLTAFS